MDTTTTKIDNSFHLWSEELKQERTVNRIQKPGIVKILPDGRVIRKFDTNIPDGRSLNGNDTGSHLVSSQAEKM